MMVYGSRCGVDLLSKHLWENPMRQLSYWLLFGFYGEKAKRSVTIGLSSPSLPHRHRRTVIYILDWLVRFRREYVADGQTERARREYNHERERENVNRARCSFIGAALRDSQTKRRRDRENKKNRLARWET